MYNQIRMDMDDKEKMAFITSLFLYYYWVMPFKLKNTGAAYQRLINKMFAELLSNSMEVYVTDMLVKSFWVKDHIQHMDQAF